MIIKGSNALKEAHNPDANLYQYIDTARYELDLATKQFNEITDDRAIDYASYNLLAARAKYSYLLQLAKEKKLSL
ncbi:MAG: DUF2508 family protein [Firmicutes bacterium]|nr:DUF2508 family protein [Bacillota bacterium]